LNLIYTIPHKVIRGFLFLFFLFLITKAESQELFTYSGKISDTKNAGIQNVTIHSDNPVFNYLTKKDGTFSFTNEQWFDSLTFSCVGFVSVKIKLQKDQIADLKIQLDHKSENLTGVVVGAKARINNYFIRKAIENKNKNNPSRFNAYSYQRYTRNELDFDNIDFSKSNGKGLKSLMIKTLENIDSTTKDDKELPVYFAENIVNVKHSVSPKVEDEIIIAEKNLGLKTDELLKNLQKFYVHFNIYEDWISVFDQTFVSPLNNNGLNYYKYLVGDTLTEKGDTIVQVIFIPLRNFEKGFNGNLWINTKNFAVVNVNMKLNKTANLDFVRDINYNEEYKFVYDSAKDDLVYMPFKYSSEIRFESGLALLGIPSSSKKKKVSFVIKNTTVTNKIDLNTAIVKRTNKEKKTEENLVNINSSDTYWQEYRPDSLSNQEKNIYTMIDSLKGKQKFNTHIKMISLIGSGYWDINNKIRLGPSSSIVSSNRIEGYRFRSGFWTMPGISKKININAYLAYGTKDQRVKGKVGVKYIWNQTRWTKTELNYSSDYDLLNGNADELDNDNIISGFFQKNTPYTKLFIKNAELKQEQFLNSNWSLNASLNYKEITPSFDFKYRPLNSNESYYDSVYVKTLPLTEVNIGLRYAHHETTLVFNYDNLKLITYSPILSANYTHGFKLGRNMFKYDKINLSIQQWLRLPPKFLLYYKIEGGSVLGTLPYLFLNIPNGNQYYISSKYVFNTMNPYEFVSDKYLSLQTRLHLGGVLFDNIPFIQKLGWRERFSFNAYWGNMKKQNLDYNKSYDFNIANGVPFMEASAGIENIFHILSVEYFKRLSYLGSPSITKGGLFFGVNIVF
jgi:hypothetical protein